MSYKVTWPPRAKKRLKDLKDRKIIFRIIGKVESTKDVPYHFMERIVEEKAWKLRVGDYRVILDIDEKNKVIIVLTVGHGKSIYQSWRNE